jgi:hypothetical protein
VTESYHLRWAVLPGVLSPARVDACCAALEAQYEREGDAGGVGPGLGRIVAVYHRASASYTIR